MVTLGKYAKIRFSQLYSNIIIPDMILVPFKLYLDKKNVTHLILSSSGSSLTSWLTPRQVYEKSREDPEIGSVMG